MLDISLIEESMMQTVSSLMALSVLQASRLVIGLTWSQDLDKLTGYKREEAQYLTDCLLSLHSVLSSRFSAKLAPLFGKLNNSVQSKDIFMNVLYNPRK